MTCKFTITIPAGSIDLVSPMDWWQCHAKLLEVMGIQDASPVANRAAAEATSANSSARLTNLRPTQSKLRRS